MTSSIVQAYHRRGESSQCNAKTRRFGAQGGFYEGAAVPHKTAEALELEMRRTSGFTTTYAKSGYCAPCELRLDECKGHGRELDAAQSAPIGTRGLA